MSKIWTAAEIKSKLEKGDRQWLTRSLMALYDYQTAQEKIAMVTVEDNKVGFSGYDAEILTSFAEQWRQNSWLSDKQFSILVRRLPKYSKQLAKIAMERQQPAQIELSVMAEASETPVVGGMIKFPNGKEVHCMDLAPKYNDENELTEWFGVVDGIKYTLIND